ncbi:YkvA family protein [Spirillospora sp. NBC_01491]|uniref:YkvA family protein n=1 Tax=Spirillospora sp. NBC_01491 TaxID=2976007 RepID=UPI002E3104B8|nr:YkvA family protein [Spirillospora sp. NBC_01491]
MDRKRSTAAAGHAWQIYSETLQPEAPRMGERVRAVPRMLKLVLRGRYKGMSFGTLGLLALATVYIVSPLDVIPDPLLPFGVVDDAGVAVWLATMLVRAAGDFVTWERGGRPTAVVGDIVD